MNGLDFINFGELDPKRKVNFEEVLTEEFKNLTGKELAPYLSEARIDFKDNVKKPDLILVLKCPCNIDA